MKNIVELGFRECRWPVHEDPEEGIKFCAEHCHLGEIYCPTHAPAALDKPHAKAKAAAPLLLGNETKRDLVGKARTVAQRLAADAHYGREQSWGSANHTPDVIELFERGE